MSRLWRVTEEMVEILSSTRVEKAASFIVEEAKMLSGVDPARMVSVVVEDPRGDLVGEVGAVAARRGGVVVEMPLRPEAKEEDGVVLVVLGEAIILDEVGRSLALVGASYLR